MQGEGYVVELNMFLMDGAQKSIPGEASHGS